MVVGGIVAGPEDKEALRLEARRQREVERTKKLGPGRLRNIGADIAGVKNQIEEKKRQEEAEKEAKRLEDEENESIRRYLLQVESEDALAKRKELLTLRNDWRYQAAQREEARQHDAYIRSIGIDPDTCAPGAAQKFGGEDVSRLERLRMQALQSKQWSQQLTEERKQREDKEKQEQDAYMSYLFEIERLQQSLHQANERERVHIASEIQRYNQMILDEKREQERRRQQMEQQQNAQEIQYVLQSNLVSENPYQAALPGVPFDQRVRVDHWKGFSGDQTKQFLSQNDQLLTEKARHAEQMRQQQLDEARQQAELHRILVEEEYNSQKKRAQVELEIKQDRERQAREAAERERKNTEQAHGKFEPGFFQAFGRSYR
uniref:RIB43A-like with coiled-coils protein 1 n=1 Tax=Globisporangium ultimum (strain ATCC 200006 / CBS 805.95 / DAOM BR144) TaxID=431595 RepID=K3WDU2_GLOUD